MAEQIGISQELLSKMEKGVIAPRFERLQQFAEALNCSIADLFRETHSPGDYARSIELLLAPLPSATQEELVEIFTKLVQLIPKSPLNQ